MRSFTYSEADLYDAFITASIPVVFEVPLTEMASSEPRRNSIGTRLWRPVDEYKCVINLNDEFKCNRLLLSYRSWVYVAWDALALEIARKNAENRARGGLNMHAQKSN